MYENLRQVRAAILLHDIVSSVNVYRRSVVKAPSPSTSHSTCSGSHIPQYISRVRARAAWWMCVQGLMHCLRAGN